MSYASGVVGDAVTTDRVLNPHGSSQASMVAAAHGGTLSSIGIVDNDELTLMVLSQYCRKSMHRDVWCATLGKRALEICLDTKQKPVGILLVDMSLNDMAGIELISTMRAWHCTVPVLAITSFPLNRYAQDAAQAGAQGIVAKRSLVDIGHAIRAIADGGVWNRGVPDVDFRSLAQLRESASSSGPCVDNRTDASQRISLSAQENAVMTLISQGLTSVSIAKELGVSVNTVKTHVVRAMHKLGASTRSQAVALWLGQRH